MRIRYRLGLAQRGRTGGDEAQAGMKFEGAATIRTRGFFEHIRDGKVIGTREVVNEVVTDTGVAYIVDAFQDLAELENMKYHAFGTGAVAADKTDAGLGAEVATRATGTTEGGASAWIYKTVGTVTFAGAFAITEHGVFSAAVAGVMIDRHVFAAINVVATDQIQGTYEFTITSGS